MFDFSGVVVISYEGSYCFFYIGYLCEVGIDFLGICSDELLYILVCDDRINLV